MKLNDVKTLVHQAVAQALGESYMSEHGYLEAIPANALVDVGKDIEDMENGAEKFTKALITILAKREIYADDFKPLFNDLMVDRVEWGGFIERAFIDFADIMDDPMYALDTLSGGDIAAIEHAFYRPKVASKVYDEGKGIMIPISIQRALLFESFRSYDGIASYVAKIRSKVRDTLKLALDRYASVMVEVGVAISAKATNTAVYLLTEALTAGVDGITSTSTAEEALENPAFLRFMAGRMGEISDNMNVPTTAYNNGTYPIAAQNKRMYMLSKVARKLSTNLYSDTYHRDEIVVNAKTVPMWQAVAGSAIDTDKFSWDTASTVAFAADNTNKLGIGTSAVTIANVAGIMFDYRAIGMTVFKEYTTSNYTACADFWNEFLHSLVNCIVDSTFPMVVFLIDFAPVSA